MQTDSKDPWAGNQPTFFLQILPALGTVRLTVGSPEAGTPSVKLINSSTVTLSVETTTGSLEQCIKLGVEVDPMAPPTPQQSEGSVHIHECKFRIKGGPWREPLSPDVRSQDLSGLEHIFCGSCGVLLTKQSFTRILPMPSPFWHELADMWICHDDFKCRSPMAKLTPGDLRPKSGDCLYDDHILNLQSSMLQPNSLRWASEEVTEVPTSQQTSLWLSIVCTRCDGPLGQGLIQPQPVENNMPKSDTSQVPSSKPKQRRAHSRRAQTVAPEVMWEGVSEDLLTAIPQASGLNPQKTLGPGEQLQVVLEDGTTLPWQKVRGSVDDAFDNTDPLSSQGPEQQPTPAQRAFGEWRFEMHEGPQSDIKLFKENVSSSKDVGKDSDLFSRNTLLRRLSFDMLQVAGAHCSYKFVIKSTIQPARPILLISLLGWTGSIACNHLSLVPNFTKQDLADGNHADPKSVVYCLYVSFQYNSVLARQLMSQWTEASPNSIETLTATEEEGWGFDGSLAQSTCLLPPGQRVLNGLPVGFLPT